MEPDEQIPQSEDLAPPSAGRGRRTLWFVSLAVVLVAAVVGAVLIGGSRGDPQKELDLVLAFADEHKTASVVIDSVVETSMSDDEGLGSESTQRSRAAGVIELPHRSRLRDRSAYGASETIVVETGVYSRWADDADELDDEPWSFDATEPEEVAEDEHGVVDVDVAGADDFGEFSGFGAVASIASGSVSAMGGPPELIAGLKHLGELERVSARTIRGRIDWKKLMPPEAINEMPDGMAIDMHAEVTSGSGDSLERLKVITTLDIPEGLTDGDDEEGFELPFSGMEMTVDIAFSEWGEPIDLGIPNADSLDLTPEVDEQELSASRDFAAYMLGAPPAGWKVTSAYIEEQDAESETCGSVDITWQDPAAEPSDEAYEADDWVMWPDVSVTSARADCPWLDDFQEFESEQPVTVGGRQATLRVLERYDDEDPIIRRSIVFVVDGVRIDVNGDVAEADLIRQASNIALLDVASLDIARSEPPPA